MHVNLMVAIVQWVAAAAIVFIYGPLNLSRPPREVLTAASTSRLPDQRASRLADT
jgi:hypothetical protein